MARPNFNPTEQQQREVKTMAMCRMRHENIALELEITPKTLRKPFRKELTHGLVEAHLKIRKTLFSRPPQAGILRRASMPTEYVGATCGRQAETEPAHAATPDHYSHRGRTMACAEGGSDR